MYEAVMLSAFAGWLQRLDVLPKPKKVDLALASGKRLEFSSQRRRVFFSRPPNADSAFLSEQTYMETTEIYGKRACQLVKELASAEPGQLTRYNDDMFNQVIKECAIHYSQFYELTRKMQEEGLDVQSTRNADHFGMLINHLSLLRNKRCLMAYVHKRAEVIQSLSWKVKFLSEEIEEKLSDPEKRYFKRHSSAIQSYTREMGGLELTVDMVPPKDPYIKVRVLDDLGMTTVGDRDTNLASHSIHFLKRTEVEHYLTEGNMEELLG